MANQNFIETQMNRTILNSYRSALIGLIPPPTLSKSAQTWTTASLTKCAQPKNAPGMESVSYRSYALWAYASFGWFNDVCNFGWSPYLRLPHWTIYLDSNFLCEISPSIRVPVDTSHRIPNQFYLLHCLPIDFELIHYRSVRRDQKLIYT